MKFGHLTVGGTDMGRVGYELTAEPVWSNPMLPARFEFGPDPHSLRWAKTEERLNSCGAFEAEFTLGAPVDGPVLPSCGPWSLGVLGAHLDAAGGHPVVTFWDGGWERQVHWKGRRFAGTVGELFLDIYEGCMS